MVQIWSRIRSQYGNASSALSNLSLTSGEEDGNDPNETVIHHALFRYYSNKQQGIPQWLGVEVAGPYGGYSQTVPSSNRHSNGQSNGPVLNAPTQSSSLQDIYNRRQQRTAGSAPNASAAPGAVHSNADGSRFRPRPTTGGRSQTFQGSQTQMPDPLQRPESTGSERSDKFRNKLRGAGRANW